MRGPARGCPTCHPAEAALQTGEQLFWSIRPAEILLLAVVGTQAIATLIAVFGLFMTPLGWGWAAFVWGYAIFWVLAADRVKLVAYRVLDSTNSTNGTAEGEPLAELESENSPRSTQAAATTQPAASYTGIAEVALHVSPKGSDQ